MTGMLFCTSDRNNLDMHSQNGDKIIYVADPTGDGAIIKQYNMLSANVLVPPYDILSKEIDGLNYQFDIMYEEYLKNDFVCEFFAALLSAIYHGINVVMYIPKSCSSLRYPIKLLHYMQNEFGIIAATKTTKFSYDMSYNNKNLKMMYYYMAIKPQEFLYSYNGKLPEQTIISLASSIGLKQAPVEELVKELIDLKNKMREEHKLLKQGITYKWKDEKQKC